jgi:hypothetical protein
LLVREAISEDSSKKKHKTDGALRQASKILSGTNIKIVETVEVKGPPTREILEQLAELGQ